MQARSKRVAYSGGMVDFDSEARSRRRSRCDATGIVESTSLINYHKKARRTGVTSRCDPDVILGDIEANIGLPTKKRRVDATTSSAEIVMRFMQTFAKRILVTRALVMATLPPSQHGVSAHLASLLGHKVFMIRGGSAATIRCMRRFITHAGVFDLLKGHSSHSSVFATRLVRCFDICGNAASYGATGRSQLAPSNLLEVAVGLCNIFADIRKRIVQSEWELCKTVQIGLKVALCRHLSKFDTELSVWYRENSTEFQAQTRRVLFNIYDTEALLRKGVYEATNCCVPKQFLQDESTRYLRQAQSVEKNFLRASTSFGGLEMLADMKVEYRKERGVSACSTITEQNKSQTLSVDGYTSETQMRSILHNQCSSDSYSTEHIHHETVLETSFVVKYAHYGRDDSCIQNALRFFKEGCEYNMRIQIHCVDFYMGFHIYQPALEAMTQLHDHLKELYIHSHRDQILNRLDAVRWMKCLQAETVSWADVVNLLHMVVWAMRTCLGTDEVRVVLYNERVRIARHVTSSTKRASNSCTGTARVKPVAYMHLKNSVQQDRAWMSGEQVDSARFALDNDVYNRLRNRVQALSGAEHSHSTPELGVLFAETLFCIKDELCKLDISIANASLQQIRSSSYATNVEIEYNAVQSWFDDGLSTTNTLAWLHQNAGVSTDSCTQWVFRGYLALIMDKESLYLDEMRYPETVILDIPYIHTARGGFFGKVAQATVLVIVGHRLAEMDIAGPNINECLQCLASEPAFVEFGQPQTCRGEKNAQDSLQQVTREALNSVGNVSDALRDIVLMEVARETRHFGYPTSPIAANIARKWTAATAKAMPDSFGKSPAIFASPAATVAAFSSDLLLPKAALCLAYDFHVNTISLVQRVMFNLAVHRERYRELSLKMTPESVVSCK